MRKSRTSSRKSARQMRAKRSAPEIADSSRASCQDFEPLLEAVFFKCFLAFAVVVGIVGVEPVALGINRQIGDLCQFWRFDQELLFGDETGDQLDFVFVQVE